MVIGLSVCTGIGAPELAAPWIDWRFQSEIDPFPAAVLAERFPNAINLGDMTKHKEWPNAKIDVLCGGTPCQSFSVAGLRAGLADPRGNLMLTYLAIAEQYSPRWLVWENVPGVLSSNGGRDFGAFLGAMGQLGYGFAYRVLDAQHCRTRSFPRAIPQRRRRVFVVGCAGGDWRRAAGVLFDAESLRGNPAPRREAGKGVAGTLGARTSGCGGAITSHDPACCLTARESKGALPEADLSTIVAYPIAFDTKATRTTIGTDVAPTLRSMSHDASHANGGGQIGIAYPIAFNLRGREGGAMPEGPYDVASIRAASGGSSRSYIADEWAVRRLTVTECERLMGFPDGWTQIAWRGKAPADCPAGRRYKALGNSWAVNCGEYVFDRLKMMDEA